MRKYTIEITSEGITKTFIDGDKTYKEVWVRSSNGSTRTKEACITAQIDQYGDFKEEELLEVLEEEDIQDIWSYFENEE